MSPRRSTYTFAVVALALMTSAAVLAQAQNVTGTWNAKFTTRIGEQVYTYKLQQNGRTLTGTAISQLGEVKLEDGRVANGVITFVERLTIDGLGERRFEYSGTLSADKIRFVRNVYDADKRKLATEEFEATKAP